MAAWSSSQQGFLGAGGWEWKNARVRERSRTEIQSFLTLISEVASHRICSSSVCHSEFSLCSAILKETGYAKASILGGTLGPFFGGCLALHSTKKSVSLDILEQIRKHWSCKDQGFHHPEGRNRCYLKSSFTLSGYILRNEMGFSVWCTYGRSISQTVTWLKLLNSITQRLRNRLLSFESQILSY